MKKIVFLGLVVLVLSVSVNFIAGCAEKSPDSNQADPSMDSTDEQNGNLEKTDTGQIKYTADYLPDKTYGGYEFRVVVPENNVFDLTLSANIEEETGDTVNDAIYRRNRLIEERYDIAIKQINGPDWWDLSKLFQKSVVSGSDDFDLGMMIARDAWATALKGAVMPIGRLPYVDISQPWYARYVNSEISINGKTYFAYSDECLNLFEWTVCVMFNKQLAADLALENMYGLVHNNRWTMDKFFELAKYAVLDLDGNGEMADKDRYGILSQHDMLYPSCWVSSGVKTVSKNENDLFIFVGDDEKLYNILEKMYQNLFGGEKIYFDAFVDKITSYQFQPGTEEQRRVSRKQFEENLGLFYVNGVGEIPMLRAMETDFGILPFPKHDETQDRYYSRIVDGWPNCVPVTAPDPERTGVVMEALAVESKNITVPAYYETALRTKYARDDESQEMLDIIHANMTMDIGDTFYMDPVRYIYVNVLNARKNNFASAVEKAIPKVEKTLATANEAALALD